MCFSSNSKPETDERTTEEYEADLQAALQKVLDSGTKADGYPFYSLRQAAVDFEVKRSTLTDRWNGRHTRREAHAGQFLLSPDQEDVLVAWLKEMALRGMGWSPDTIKDAASKISGKKVGEKWFRLFRTRHPDVKLMFTRGLEACRATSLNRTQVMKFYDIVEEVLNQHDITPDRLYNMDEKGVQLGVGGRKAVLVDASQKVAYQIENGSREMATIIECVAADGTAVTPMIIYKAATCNLEWGRNNPLGAAIAHSPNGWTDTELALLWLEKVFIPFILAKHGPGVTVTLTLDGQNSHVTYLFAKLAAKYGIQVIILPAHTTHRLQPCDVAVFSPLASAYKKVVNEASMRGELINKRTLPTLYARAREAAFKPSTIRMAFRKSGLFPFNRNAIEEEAYAPSKLTSTKSSMPIPVTIPDWLQVQEWIGSLDFNRRSYGDQDSVVPNTDTIPLVEMQRSSGSRESSSETMHAAPKAFRFANLPQVSRRNASYQTVLAENTRLRELLHQSKKQMESDHARKVLMEEENGRIRHELNGKKDKVTRKRAPGEGQPRLLTGAEQLDALAHYDWKKKWEELLTHRETKDKFKEQRQKIAEEEERREKEVKAAAREEQARARDVLKLQKAQEKVAEKERKALEKIEEKKQKAEERQKKAEERKKERAAAAQKKKNGKSFEKAMKGKPTKSKKDGDGDVGDEIVFPTVLADLSNPRPKRTRRAAITTQSAQQKENQNNQNTPFSNTHSIQKHGKASSEVHMPSPLGPRTRRQTRSTRK